MTWAWVKDTTTDGTSSPLVLSVTNTAGNALILTIEAYVSGSGPLSVSSVTDNASGGSNTWQYSTATSNQNPPVNGAIVGGSYGMAAIAVCLPSDNGGTVKTFTQVTVTFNTAPTGTAYVGVSEFTGVPAGTVIDNAASNAPLTSGLSFTTPAVVTTGPSDVVMAVTAQDIAWSSVNSPYTAVNSFTDPDAAYAVSQAAGSQSATFNAGSSNEVWACSILAIGVPAATFLAPPNRRPRGQAVNRASTY